MKTNRCELDCNRRGNVVPMISVCSPKDATLKAGMLVQMRVCREHASCIRKIEHLTTDDGWKDLLRHIQPAVEFPLLREHATVAWLPFDKLPQDVQQRFIKH